MVSLYDYCKQNNKEYLLQEWDYELNIDLDPKILLPKSNKKVWWKCTKCGHKWFTSINSRIGRNSGCPACSGRVPTVGVNDLFTVRPDLKEEWDFEQNKDMNPLELKEGSHAIVWWKCSKCGYKYKLSVKQRTKNQSCPCCSNRVAVAGVNDLFSTRPDLKEEWDYELNKDINPLELKEGSHAIVWWKCSKCGYKYKLSVKQRAKNQNCPCCANRVVVAGINDLSTTHPEIAKEWHPTKNGNLTPYMFTSGISQKVWWKCATCGHEWEASIKGRTHGSGCPLCTNSRVVAGINDLATIHPEIAKEWDYERNAPLAPNQVLAGSNKRVWWICSHCGHKWKTAVYHRAIKGTGCTNCYYSKRKNFTTHNNLTVTHPDLVKDWHPYKNGEFTPDMFTKYSNYKVWWKCHICGKEVETEIKNYSGCITCKKQIILNERNLKITHPHLIEEWNYTKNTVLPDEVLASNPKKVWWKCQKCGYEWQAKISNRAVLNRGCPCCSNRIVITGVNDLATTEPEIAKEWHPTKNGDLTPEKISRGNGKKVWWLCSQGHEYQATVLHRTQDNGTGCPICNSGRQTSFAEQAVYYYVKKLYPDAINRYTADFLGRMELDIFIPSINYAIEYDGEAWHRGDAKLKREEKKYKLCKSKNIKLVRLREKEAPLTAYIADMQFCRDRLYEYSALQNTIQLLLEYLNFSRIGCPIDVNLKRDKKEILKYKYDLNKNSLQDKFPEIAKEWHPTKNGELKPSMFKAGSDHRVWWKCVTCGHEWETAIGHRTGGKKPTGCPKCSIKKTSSAHNRAVNMIDTNTNQIIRTFSSISEASHTMNTNGSNISMVCKGQRNYAGDYKWEYASNNQ